MKRLFIAAAAACLLASAPALAAHHDHGGGGGGHQNGGGHQGGGATHTTRAVHVQRNNFNAGGSHVSRTVRTNRVNVIRGGTTHSRTVRHVSTTRTIHGRSVTTHRTAVNVRSFRRNVTSAHRYHFGTYNRPHGWYAHRWVYGERVPHGWYGRNYWISDFVSFGLIAPPDGYQWVRVGDDALLIDVDSGEVLQVEYGVFY